MTQIANAPVSTASLEEIQESWHELTSRVGQLEAERNLLEQEVKGLRFLLERVIDHRQKSHSELVLLITGLVSKLQINDIGVIVSRLVEHNTNVSQYLAALVKGASEDDLAFAQPSVLKNLEETKRELVAAIKPVIEELGHLDTPLEGELLQSLVANPG